MLVHTFFLACTRLHSVVPFPKVAKKKEQKARSAKLNVFSQTKPNKAHKNQWGEDDIDVMSLVPREDANAPNLLVWMTLMSSKA